MIATGALIVTVYAWVVEEPVLSRARIVKVVEPAAIGVPETTPVLAVNVRPAGRLPAETLNVNAGVPPVVASV